MQTNSLVWRFIGSLAIAFFLSSLAASAADLSVDCSGGTPGYYTTIKAALDSLPSRHGPHTISVSGTCNENVSLDGFTYLTIQSAPGPMATIKAAKANQYVVDVWDSTRIVLQRLLISGGTRGVMIYSGSSVQIVSSKVEGNSAQGIWVSGGARAWVYGTAAEPASLSNNNQGAFLLDSSLLWISGYTNIDGNGNRGINVAVGGQIEAWGTGNTVSGNGWKNGNGPGLLISTGKVDLNGFTIANNYGPAIVADNQSAVALANSTLTGNADGLQVFRASFARLGAAVSGKGPVSVVTNGQTDLACDGTSLVTGDLSGVGTIACARIERELGPPRPGELVN